MLRFGALIAVSIFSIFFVVSGQEMDRKVNGDLLFASGLDCSLHNASQVGDGVCVCSGSGSYYTDQNNVTRCFKGRGEEEFGCTIYPEEDPRKRIYTVDPAKTVITYLTSNRPQCEPKYENFLIWRNGTWESYPSYREIVGVAYKSIPGPTGNIVRQLGFVYSELNATQKARVSGNLFRFNFTLCDEPSCFMFKYEGKLPWEPHVISTTVKPSTTVPGPTGAPKTGDDDDSDLLIKVLVPVCVIIFMIIFITIIILVCKHRNSRVSKEDSVFVGDFSPVPQPTVKKGHVNRGQVIDITDQSAEHMNVQDPKKA